MSAMDKPWQRYICRACGLIYDERIGDPDSGLAPGTRFSDIPEDWQCPLCGVKKSDFELFKTPDMAQVPSAAQLSFSNRKAGVIIIGGGIAGWSVAKAIRQLDATQAITLITACAGDIYHKPALSLALARGLSAAALVEQPGEEAAKRLGINLLHHTFVTGISSKLKSVRTTRGSLCFTALVLAMGAENVVPDTIPPQWCWRINHINAWSGLQQKLAGGPKQVAIVGAGMVGCELAENLLRAGHRVSFIFREATPLASLLPDLVGRRFATLLKRQGLDLFPGCSVNRVEKISPSNRPVYESEMEQFRLHLSNAPPLIAQQIVVAIGLKSDKRLALQAGLQQNNGILVDKQSLQTSKQNIYALGDCISFAGETCRFILPIAQQAKVIAARICGVAEAVYQHQPPVIRLKVQSCSIELNGEPKHSGSWQLINETAKQITMAKIYAGKEVSKLIFNC